MLMLVRRSLQAGLITGVAMLALLLVLLVLKAVARPIFTTIWPLVFAPLVVTGVVAVLRAGRGVTGPASAALAGALGGLMAALVSLAAFTLAVALQTAFSTVIGAPASF